MVMKNWPSKEGAHAAESNEAAMYSIKNENNNWLQVNGFILYITPHLCSEGRRQKPRGTLEFKIIILHTLKVGEAQLHTS